MAAIPSTATAAVHLHLPLQPNQNKSSLPPQPPHASATVTEAETSLLGHRRTNFSINVPASLANFLHLHLSGKHENNNSFDVLPTPQSGRRTPAWSPKEDISSLCDQLHGFTDWSSLLNPLHPWLRREILKYGELTAATYDAFDFNPFSEYCGSCLYGRNKLFEKLGLSRHGYQVTKYLYAMSHVDLPRWLERSLRSNPWSNDSNWIGYVAVSNDEETHRIGCRDIVVAWRGTVTPSEWFEDLQGRLDPLDNNSDDAMVEHGFLSMYRSKNSCSRYNKTSASEQVMEEIMRLVDYYKQKGEQVSLTITGHSLGGALALLNAYDAIKKVPALPVSVISFGAPRVGNEAFTDQLKAAGAKVLRLVVKQDAVPKVPGILFNENLHATAERLAGELRSIYMHAGVELGLDVNSSPYLKHGKVDVAAFHNIETYLHLVDGYLSAGGKFRATAKRDVALVNKSTGLLRDDFRVPVCWHQSANKGLVCNGYGRWVLPRRDPEDIPSPLAGRRAPAIDPAMQCCFTGDVNAANSPDDLALIL